MTKRNLLLLNTNVTSERRAAANYERLGSKCQKFVAPFAKAFPLSKDGNPAEFPIKFLDMWLAENNLLDGHRLPAMVMEDYSRDVNTWRPVEGTSSDSWMAHVQRRGRAIADLNKATSHRRVRELGLHPFHIDPHHGVFTLYRAEEKIALGELPTELETFMNTKKRRVERLMRSADFGLLGLAQQDMIETLHDGILKLEQNVKAETEFLKKRYKRLQIQLSSMLNEGKLIPKNHGLKEFIKDDLEGDGVAADAPISG